MKKNEENKETKLKKNIDKIDIMRDNPSLYFAKVGEVSEVVIPELSYLNFEGEGDPAKDDFAKAFCTIYSVGFATKHVFKELNVEFELPASQCTWFVENYYENFDNKDGWKWRLSIALPKFVYEKHFLQAMNNLKEMKKYTEYHNSISFERKSVSKALQTLHIGAYENEKDNLKILLSYAKDKGIELIPYPQEIYLSDPSKVPVDKLKTILRYNCK